MITVSLNLHSARTKQTTPLGFAVIVNDGKSGTDARGNYNISVARKNSGAVLRRGTVLNWPKKSYNVWRLVTRLLIEAFPEERPKPAQKPAHARQGFMVVPIEPTPEMLSAAQISARTGTTGDPYKDLYYAMLQAAPGAQVKK